MWKNIKFNRMKKTAFMAALLVTFLTLSIHTAEAQQLKLPPASSSQTIVQTLGISKATLTYNRPNTNGRQIFGDLVPMGEVWRTGANNIPVLTTETNLMIAGYDLPPGSYGILTIPGEQEWTVIISSNSQQWGAYQYKEEEDLFRFNVQPVHLDHPVESFTMGFSDVTPSSAALTMAWAHTGISFSLIFDQDADIMASIEEVMAGTGNKPYFQAAQYYYAHDKDLDKALEWAKKAVEASPQAAHILLLKGRIQLKAGDRAGAIETATAGIELATEAKNDEYVRLNTQLLKQATN